MSSHEGKVVRHGMVTCQPVTDSDIIKHPGWDHVHFVWLPVWLNPEQAERDLDLQRKVFQHRADDLLSNTPLAGAAWEKPWVMSYPVVP